MKKKIIEDIWKIHQMLVYKYITQAATMAKFKRYDEILPYIEKVKEEYNNFTEEGKGYDFFKNTLNEALLLEEKVKEGKESIDSYIEKREKQSLIELGLEKLIK